MSDAFATRRDYLCAEFARCFAYVSDLLVQQGKARDSDAWRAAWSLGSEHFEYPGEGHSTQAVTAVALVRVEFTRSDDETLDNAAGRATHLIERSILAYARPRFPYENDICRVSIVWLDTDAVIPSYDENGITGTIFIPVNMRFNLTWKKQK